MKNIQMLRWTCTLALIATVSPRLVFAQARGSWTPTAADCQKAADSLAAGARNFVAWSYLSQCSSQGAAALASAVARARLESDTTYLDALLSTARSMQDSTILRAALDLALDGGAALPARIMGLDVSLGEYFPSDDFRSDGGWAELLTPRGMSCALSTVTESDYTYASTMPANAAQRIAEVADTIMSRSGDPQAIRDLASCVRRALSKDVPITVPPSALQFLYVCGNKFRSTNSSAKPAQLTYDVVGQNLSFGLVVPANGTAAFITEKAAQIRVYQGGQLLATVENSNVPCP